MGSATVDLIIRQDGQGPVWLCPTYIRSLRRMTDELIHTRFITWFSPCPWGAADGFGGVRNFLHRTRIGRWIVDKFWRALGSNVSRLNRYDEYPLVRQLKPWNALMWSGSGISIHNYDTDFFELVRSGRIRVHITDVARLDGNTVFLENGERIETDVVVCSTGWKKDSTIKFLNLGEAGLGLPFTTQEKALLNKQADEEILAMFPALRDQPVLRSKAKPPTSPDSDPLRLYRFIVAPTMVGIRNIAFAGMLSTASTSIFAALQGLWITAYFDGKLDRLASQDNNDGDGRDEITREVMLHTQWGKWRYPCGYGARLPDFAFDALCYVDLMMRDLGLRHRRKGSLLAELFEPYKPSDYAGLVQE